MAETAELGERQQGVVDALEARSPRLAGMYRFALGVLQTGPEAGSEAARIAAICHSVREIMNGLPVVMSDVAIPRPNPSTTSFVSKLPELIGRHGVDFSLDQDMVPVPREVGQMLSGLVTAAIQEEGRNRKNAAALVTGTMDGDHPAVKQWRGTQSFFLGWAHLDRNHEQGRSLPGDEEILSNLRVVEDVIVVRTTIFFDNLRAVKDLLTEINTVEDEG